MRALRRVFLTPLIMAAAFMVASAPAHHAAMPAHASVALARACPAGTNWDHILNVCI
jgi:hypothetical protein